MCAEEPVNEGDPAARPDDTEDDVLADLVARCPQHGTRTETWPECRCAAARQVAAALRTPARPDTTPPGA